MMEGHGRPKTVDELNRALSRPVSNLPEGYDPAELAKASIQMANGVYEIEEDDQEEWTEFVRRGAKVVAYLNGLAKFGYVT